MNRAKVLAPTFPSVYYRLTAVYRQLGEPGRADEAMALFKKYDQGSRATVPRGMLGFVEPT